MLAFVAMPLPFSRSPDAAGPQDDEEVMTTGVVTFATVFFMGEHSVCTTVEGLSREELSEAVTETQQAGSSSTNEWPEPMHSLPPSKDAHVDHSSPGTEVHKRIHGSEHCQEHRVLHLQYVHGRFGDFYGSATVSESTVAVRRGRGAHCSLKTLGPSACT